MLRLRYASLVLTGAALLGLAAEAAAQPPVARPLPPPPVGGAAQAPVKAPAKPAAPAAAATAQPGATAQRVQPPADTATEASPTDAQLGIRIYPGARFLGSYDAGRGQRFYLFGTQQSFGDMVAFYRSELKDKGELVFDAPATHMFDVGKFREETMAFPPSVTIKDYTWGGSPGFANPTPGTAPAAYPTVIQIVPPPPGGPIR